MELIKLPTLYQMCTWPDREPCICFILYSTLMRKAFTQKKKKIERKKEEND